MPGKKTVSVKRFLTDFRSGASDADLMMRHGLDRRGLQKMLSVLEDRQLIAPEDLKRNRYVTPERQRIGSPSERPDPVSETKSGASSATPETAGDAQTTCSQCGAHVTERMLTCPECGHVLPGEMRWSRVQPEKSSRLRVPPWLLGCIIALPIALGLYALFKHILIPMSTASIHRRTHAVGKPVPKKPKPRPAVADAKPAVASFEEQLQRLTDEGVLLKASADYTVFTVSDQWYALTRDEKIAFLTQIGSALLASDLDNPFRVKDDAGILAARVSPQAIELLDRYGFSETIQRPGANEGQQPKPENVAPKGAAPLQQDRSLSKDP